MFRQFFCFPVSSTYKRLLVCLISCASIASAAPNNEYDRFLERWDRFLKTQVDRAGRIDYKAVQNAPQELDASYEWIATHSPDSHPALFANEAASFSYWLNAYNLATIQGVVAHYPIESVLDVSKRSFYDFFEGGGFFAAQKFHFGDKRISLYRLENKIIRKRFDDPRLHFALNCASQGCPVLPNEAFRPERLDAQLGRETRLFVNSDQHVKIDHATQTIGLSAIFDWYANDFEHGPSETREQSLLNYVQNHLYPQKLAAFKEARQAGYTLRFLSYDWSLNDQKLR